MAINRRLQFVRGNTARNNAFTGREGELTVDTTTWTLRVHDGVTPGGNALGTSNFSGDYDDLTNKPTIPADVSDLTDTGGILSSGFSGAYADLTGAPVIPSDLADLTDDSNLIPTDISQLGDATGVIPTDVSQLTDTHNIILTLPQIIVGLATESYVDDAISNLVNAAPGTLDTLNELAAAIGDDPNYAATVSGLIGAKANAADLSTVATTGSYNHLTDKPFIPYDANELTDADGLFFSGSYDDLSDKPVLFSGAYADLTGKPDQNLNTTSDVDFNSILLPNGAVIKDNSGDSIAFGQGAGETDQGHSAVALGEGAGYNTQGNQAIAVGRGSGNVNQGVGAIGIGFCAGATDQGDYSVAIGFKAARGNMDADGTPNQPANSIMINASSTPLNGDQAGLYINPVREDVANVAKAVYYNATTKELTYADPTGSGSGDSLLSDNSNITVTIENANATPGNTLTWTFDTDGFVNLPNGGVVGDIFDEGMIGIQADSTNPSAYASLVSGDKQQAIDASNDEVIIWTDDAAQGGTLTNQWRFNRAGQMIFPDSSVQTTAYTGAYADLTGAPTTVSSFTNDSNYVRSNTSGITGADQVTNMVTLTQAEYDAITPNASTVYFIVG